MLHGNDQQFGSTSTGPCCSMKWPNYHRHSSRRGTTNSQRPFAIRRKNGRNTVKCALSETRLYWRRKRRVESVNYHYYYHNHQVAGRWQNTAAVYTSWRHLERCCARFHARFTSSLCSWTSSSTVHLGRPRGHCQSDEKRLYLLKPNKR